MLRLWPPTADTRTLLTNDELANAYAYPPGLGQPYVRVNFVSSVDGAASSGGKSAALGSDADRRVFGLLRELCEVIVVGAGTARAENYRGARRPSRATGTPPRIAVVTARGDLDPAAPLFTDTSVPPLVITANACPPDARDRLRAAGAEVVVLDEDRVGPAGLLAALDERGLRRVLCEGGPGLFGDLIAADGVDEMCLTISPVLAGGDSPRISHGPSGALRGMRLVGALTDEDVLLLRYARDR
ncbi:MAG TPA: pyrimidine reductase family protein [Pseudonocardia sp.]|nr:pyrimidine reductase family protein [Pseudonocardia sp.]